MMRAWTAILLLAATLVCGAPVSAGDPPPDSKKGKTNFFTADNGLGAAAVGEAALAVGAMALSGPGQWQGYPHGDDGIPFANDNPAAIQFGSDDCAAKESGNLAKALMAQKDAPRQTAAVPQGVLSLSDPDTHTAAQAYDSKAMYQSSGCPNN